jgi:3-dehydroshikimate dehydratase
MRLLVGRGACAALLSMTCFSAAAQTVAAAPQVLTVDRYEDDGAQGSLRWAIETSNQSPGLYRIEIVPIGVAPYVIRPKSELPAIKGPVAIVGTAHDKTGEYIAIDGSAYVIGDGEKACPGAAPGQFGTNVRTTTAPGLILRDTQEVELTGLEVRNFCIGVLINRSSHNRIHDNRIVANKGGSGIMLTGDDGKGNATATTTVHNRVERNEFLDNGDGLELTRGAAFNLVAQNLFRSTSANPEPSQGIEILWGNDNFVARNRFEGYSDGLQINWGNRNTIAANRFSGNAVGLNISGEGNVIDGNVITGNGVGIGLRPQASAGLNRITQNSIYGNGLKIERCYAGGLCDDKIPRSGILFGLPGLEHWTFVGSRGGGVTADPAKVQRICPDQGPAGAPACQGVPNGGIAAPVLAADSSWKQDRLAIDGRFSGQPNERYRFELFANPLAKSGGDVEGKVYLGSVDAYTDADGKARFAFETEAVDPLDNAAKQIALTATATSVAGASSAFSAPITLKRR